MRTNDSCTIISIKKKTNNPWHLEAKPICVCVCQLIGAMPVKSNSPLQDFILFLPIIAITNLSSSLLSVILHFFTCSTKHKNPNVSTSITHSPTLLHYGRTHPQLTRASLSSSRTWDPSFNHSNKKHPLLLHLILWLINSFKVFLTIKIFY